MAKNRFGGTTPQDFISAAIDGLQYRLDGIQATLEALRATVDGFGIAPPAKRLGRPPKALPPATEPRAAQERRGWTPEQRAKHAATIAARNKAKSDT